MTVDDVFLLINADMDRVNSLIHKTLRSDVALINQISHYIINSGGKRLRPILVLLCTNAFKSNSNSNINDESKICLATVVEYIHTATLLHDDVVDESAMRRGTDTANELWGNAASVLVGDFLYSRAFEMMVSVDNMRVMEILSHATNIIAEGEVLQLLNCNDASTTEARYLEVIHFKTAKLFEAAAQLGAVIANQDKPMEEAMARYGMHLGTSFQLIDDVLDYSAGSDEIGKNVGDDLAEGKPTLPLIYAMRNGNSRQAELIKTAIEQGGREHIDEITRAIKSSGALEYTLNAAKKESQLAIEALSDLAESEYRDALIKLANFAVERSY